MVYEKLLEWPAGCAQTLEAAEMWKFFELCGSLVMYEPRPRREILTCLLYTSQTAPTGPNQQDLDDMLDNLTIFDQ